MGNLVIVGNAVLGLDYSRLVDAADIVIRINDCKNYNGMSGSKTTIICANNTGSPARRAAKRKKYMTHPLCSQASEYWFPRCSLMHKDFARQTAPEFPLSEFDDFSQQIVSENELGDKVVAHLSTEFNVNLFKKVFAEMHRRKTYVPFMCPSTGLFAIEHALASPLFSHLQLHVVGFGFEGWDGHPWDIERGIVDGHAQASRLWVHPL